MARNIHTMAGEEPARTIPETEQATRDSLGASHEKILVTPLMHLLMQSQLEDLLSYLQSLKIRFTLSTAGGSHKKWTMKIIHDGMVHYEAYSMKSPKAAMVEAIVKFLIGENKDFHCYQGGEKSEHVNK